MAPSRPPKPRLGWESIAPFYPQPGAELPSAPQPGAELQSASPGTAGPGTDPSTRPTFAPAPPVPKRLRPITSVPSTQPIKRPRPPPPPPPADLAPTDELGELVATARARLRRMSFAALVHHTRGRSCLAPTVHRIRHTAGPFLGRLRRHGAPVPLATAPPDRAARDRAMDYGSHSSTKEHGAFTRSEMADFVRKGYWLVLPYEDVCHLRNLRLSPMGCIPQRDRRPRLIIDYTWSGVNPETVRLAPDSMQFGRALLRVLQRIYDADPRHGPVHMLKLDISDGFYRVWLSVADIPALAVAMPPGPDGERLVAFPLVLPMGWVQSPPYFCSVTETIADMANDTLTCGSPVAASHPLEELAASAAPEFDVPPCGTPMHCGWHPNRQPMLSYVDVYVDDFLGLSQGSPERRAYVRRALLEALDQVIRPLDPADNPARKEPASVKKLAQGDASWATQKILLGWLVDTIQGTIQLPPHRVDRLHTILAEVRGRRRISLRKWRALLGELRSMMVALPGSEGLFSHLQDALSRQRGGRIRVNEAVANELADWDWLANDLARRPTSIAECVRKAAARAGACDAAGHGMGGVVFDLTTSAPPVCWRARFPAEVTDNLVSFDNPRGSITNSDLELAGVVAQHDVVARTADVRHTTVATWGDNTPSVAWTTRGSVSRDCPAAYLLRLLALHRRHYRYSTAISHLAGILNGMADDCSRLWELTDDEFLRHMNLTYPQAHSWRLFQLPSATLSALTSALFKMRLPPELWLSEMPPTPKSGVSGPGSAATWGYHPTSPSSRTRFLSSRFLPTAFGEATSRTTAPRYEHVLLRRTSGPLARRSPGWGPPTPG